MPRAIAALGLLALWVAAGPAASRQSVCERLAGGDPDSGIGGTGHEDPESGIGGTGIFGTITGFASICVNGLEVHYEPDVPVTTNGEPATAADLAVGRVVWIVAAQRDGRLVASSIALLSALIGPLEEVDAQRGRLRVAGEWVELPASTLVLAPAGGSIEPGDRVDVSGLRRPDGRVVASRVELAGPGSRRSSTLRLDELLRGSPPLARLSAEGFAEEGPGPGRFRLNGLEVDAGPSAPRRPSGARLRVEGSLLPGEILRADRIRFDRGAAPERPGRPDAKPTPEPPQQIERPEPIERPEAAPRPDALIRPEPFERELRP